jgi:anti-sigma regulatory factor (Ser/Thr protein kinase)
VAKLNSNEIREFILRSVTKHPGDISAVTANHFDITRQAAHWHVASLVKKGLLKAEGATRSRRYSLQPTVDFATTLAVRNLAEDKVWREHVAPLLEDLPANVFKICNYGFTEMVNNVIDHSEGTELAIAVVRTPVSIDIKVADNGIGIFNKLQKELALDDPLHSLLELSKGKLTTDPKRHSGEGIFYSSRMFDLFMIRSGNIVFAHLVDSDFLLDSEASHVQGTEITMRIDLASKKTTQAVFDAFTVDNAFGFDKTIVPVFLSAYGDENLVSRSQAKRLLARFEVFKVIMLDFSKVVSIGQAFADEVFRVFADEHPDIKLVPIRASEQIENMIKHVTANPEE